MQQSNATIAKPSKPARLHRHHLSPLARQAARELLVERRRPVWLVASCFGISEATARRLRSEGAEDVA